LELCRSFLSLGNNEPFSGGIAFRDGRAWLPDAPELGIEVGWKKLAPLSKRAASA